MAPVPECAFRWVVTYLQEFGKDKTSHSASVSRLPGHPFAIVSMPAVAGCSDFSGHFPAATSMSVAAGFSSQLPAVSCSPAEIENAGS